MTESQAGSGTREKILIAAATMLGEDATARLSVRAVAARAGVSTGSLRHFFPTQQELIDAVVAVIHEVEIEGDPITDLSLPADERLLACLQQFLTYVGTGERARDVWRGVYRAYIEQVPSADAAAVYVSLEREGQRRIEGWLRALADEGALPADGIERHARFLSALLNGLSIERALPADTTRHVREIEVLASAVRAVLPRT